ncbi:VOC family protein [Plantactinospora sp. GCM10030261]|uniref:VOC family protein n=1 Tax=Plantactinospora sp. GCM10030261 TaxID=3273420 RepID=UPI003618C899
MSTGLRTIIYPVRDLAQAKALFGDLLGVTPYMDEPYYVGFDRDGQDVGLDPHGHDKGMTGPVGYWHVDDIEASLGRLLAVGAKAEQDIKDVGGGKLVASVRDVDGNVIGLIQTPSDPGLVGSDNA